MVIKSFGLNSEYEKLTSVLLYAPGPEIAGHPDPAAIQHLQPIDYPAISREYAALRRFYETLGIRVVTIDPTPMCDDRHYCFNMMYCRDLVFMTPKGAIIGNMAHETRGKEPQYANRTLVAEGIPVLHAVSGDGRFEGADALWAASDLVLVGIGKRTNLSGFEQAQAALRKIGVQCHAVPLIQNRTQHLLGVVQFVDSNLALVRHEICGSDVIRFLEERRCRVIHVPEHEEVLNRQAMNMVTIAPRTIVMTAGCPETKQLYQAAGLKIAAELEIEQLMRGAGGLACATGILARGHRQA